MVFNLASELPEFAADMAPGLAVPNPAADLGTSIFAPPASNPVVVPPAGTGGSSMTTGDATCKPSSLNEAFLMLTFPENLREPLLNLVGADGDADPSVVASLPFDDFREAVSSELVLADGSTPTLFQKGRFYKFFKDLMKLFADPIAPSSTALVAAPPSTSPILLEMQDNSTKLYLKDFIDQTMPGTFTVLPESDIAALRANYVTRTGGFPDLAERPSDEQISAMAHILKPGDDGRIRPPFAEFATFVPHETRSTKLKTFQAMVLNRDGSWAQKAIRGPPSFAAWESCWNVYACTLIMLDVATPGALKTYYQGFRRLYQAFPNLWGTLAGLEEHMRAEEWTRIRQEYAEGITQPPSDYNPAKPWMSIIPSSRPFFTLGPRQDWWSERLLVLERSSKNHKAIPNDTVMPGVLPSLLGQSVLPQLVGTSSSSSAAPPPPAPLRDAPLSKRARKRQHQQQVE